MAVKPGPPPFDPSQKQPVLQGAQDTDPYVGKPKPMPKPVPHRPVYGSSDGSGFDFAKWQAGQHRPRPTMILPGQGQGPMPVGTKPLPSPVVKDARGDSGGAPIADMGDNRLNRGGGMRAMGDYLKGLQGQAGFGGGMQGQGGSRDNNAGRLSQQAIANGLMDDRGYPGGNMKPGGMGPGGQIFMDGDPRAPRGGDIWNPMQAMKPGGMGPGGQDPMYGGAGTGPSYGGPNQARDFNVPNYGAPVQRGPMGAPGGPPPVGTGPGSMGKPQQPGGGMPSREGGARHRQAPQQVNPQAMQQGAQALYNDNTIPHEFKGQLLQAAQSGNAQAFNEMLFNSGIPHETKLRLQQMFGYGSGAGAAPQAATPDQGQNQVQQSYSGGKGSPYYGAF